MSKKEMAAHRRRFNVKKLAALPAMAAVTLGNAFAQLPAPTAPTGGAAAGDIRQFANNTAVDYVAVIVPVLVVAVVIGIGYALFKKFNEFRNGRADLGDLGSIGVIGAMCIGVVLFLGSLATTWLTNI